MIAELWPFARAVLVFVGIVLLICAAVAITGQKLRDGEQWNDDE